MSTKQKSLRLALVSISHPQSSEDVILMTNKRFDLRGGLKANDTIEAPTMKLGNFEITESDGTLLIKKNGSTYFTVQ